MFPLFKRRHQRPRRTARQPLCLEVLEDRTLLSTTPTTILDANGIGVNPNQYSSTDILVQFQGTPGTPGGPAVVTGTSLGGQLPLTDFYEVNLDKGMTVDQALAAYKAESGVVDAEPDYDLTVSSVPNDPLLNQQWAINNTGQNGGTPGADMHAEQAWSVTTGSPNVVVAVMDTGIDYDQPDLYDNIWINQAEIPNSWYVKSSDGTYDQIVYKSQIQTATPGIITFRDLNNPVNKGLVTDNNSDGRIDAGDLLRPISQGGWENNSTQDGDSAHPDDLFGWNFVSNTNNPMDDNGHGTNVAGILGADGNNGVGVAGVDWNVQIMPVKFIGSNGEGSVSDFINGLNYAVQHGAKITNNSWEGAPYSSALYDAFQNAQSHGVICVAAAGNEGSNDDVAPDYPASLSTSLNNVVAVAATDNNDQLASFSNYGANSVALAAPGVNIVSTLPNGQYGPMSGTSMATPEVTGTMALVWGLHPNWSYSQVINQVVSSTDKLPSLQGKVSSGGRLDVANAVGWTLTTRTIPTVATVTPWGPNPGTMQNLLLTFNEPIDASSLSVDNFSLTDSQGHSIPLLARLVNGSGDKQVALWFGGQTVPGNYTLSVQGIRDIQGNTMSSFTKTINLAQGQGVIPAVTSVTSGGPNANTMQYLTLNFNEPINPSTLTYDNITLTDTNGILLQLVIRPSSDDKQLVLWFGGQTKQGNYVLSMQGVRDQYGNQMAPFSNTVTFIPGNGSTSTDATNGRTPPPTTTPPNAATYTNNSPSSITPWGLTVSSLFIPTGTSINNIQVKLNATYPTDGNLYMYLIAPDGQMIPLTDQRGGSGANFTNTTFSDRATTAIGGGTAPFSGTYRPESSLSQLTGLNTSGTWRLAVRNYGSSSGSLNNWSLVIS